MDRQPLYFTVFILAILIGSSLYLSWSADRGMGEITAQRISLERSGRPIEILVYQPRTEAMGDTLDPMPIILSLHGIAGSKEGMYSFNIELARRNFTVISMDLPGHGDSTLPFIVTDFDTMAQDAYYALRHVQTTFPNVHNESYGVISHSHGFRVGIEMKDYPIAPMAYAAVGDVGQMELGEYLDFPGNLIIAIGEYDEMISNDLAINAIREATGNSSAEAGVTYGSFSNKTAYRLAFAPTDHVFEAVDGTIVSETTTWLVQGVQGEAQLAVTLDPLSQVYFYKTIATFTGAMFLLVSTIPLMILVYYSIPEKLKPRKIPLNTESFSLPKTFLISSIMGAATIILYAATTAAGFHLENIGLAWPNSMFATGLWIYYFLAMICLLVIMRIFMGRKQTALALASVGIERRSLREHTTDILKGLAIVIIPIAWIMFWLAIAGLPETMHPYTIVALLKWPVGDRALNTFIVATLSVPFLLVEAAWIRGLLLSKRDWKGAHHGVKNFIFAFVAKFAISSVLAVFVVFATTALGLIAGKMVLLGLLLLLMLVIQILTTVITAYTAVVFENTWPAVIIAAFLLAIVAMSSLPLV
ncbi:MAG: alpha/beta fold hydrolase [Candidatus Thorarchaeota archaeon]|jgi:pimeloyl-ACP methyl ester carboxylesterase